MLLPSCLHFFALVALVMAFHSKSILIYTINCVDCIFSKKEYFQVLYFFLQMYHYKSCRITYVFHSFVHSFISLLTLTYTFIIYLFFKKNPFWWSCNINKWGKCTYAYLLWKGSNTNFGQDCQLSAKPWVHVPLSQAHKFLALLFFN